uniref:Uncharacterized protein n=1 Tax=Bracon brevicornis TaxID=1563983 RepID=A0A6V7LAY5_9HYME
MLRRNIDVGLGLVNETIAFIESAVKSIMRGTDHIQEVNIMLELGQTYSIERTDVKFEILNGVYITRKQSPFSLSYGKTIPKSQGLCLRSAVMDLDNTVLSVRQTYVAVSRVTTLLGVHSINSNPRSILVQKTLTLATMAKSVGHAVAITDRSNP